MPKLLTCPNCGVDAIVTDKDTKPEDQVECNNCHWVFVRKDLKRR